MILGSSTLNWLARAADSPLARHPDRLPESLEFVEHASVFLSVFHGAPAGAEIGFPLVLREARLHFPEELTSQARYLPFMEGGRFIGTFHVHPPSTQAPPPPFFDPRDLASALRSDNSGFIELLLAYDRLFVLVRCSPYLYISARHVDRNPLLLLEQHTGMVRRRGAREPGDPTYPEDYRRAGLYYFERYGLALYEGSPDKLLKRTFTPQKTW